MIPLQHPASSRFLTALVSNLVAGLLVILFLFTWDRFQARASLGELALVSEVSTGTAGTGKPQRGRGLKCVAEMMTWGSWKFSILRSKVVRISMAIEVVGFVWGLWPLPLLGFLLVIDWDVWGGSRTLNPHEAFTINHYHTNCIYSEYIIYNQPSWTVTYDIATILCSAIIFPWSSWLSSCSSIQWLTTITQFLNIS